MSKRSIVVIAAVGVVGAVLWICGHALWHNLLAMHGR
jgi:hypothetical protein